MIFLVTLALCSLLFWLTIKWILNLSLGRTPSVWQWNMEVLEEAKGRWFDLSDAFSSSRSMTFYIAQRFCFKLGNGQEGKTLKWFWWCSVLSQNVVSFNRFLQTCGLFCCLGSQKNSVTVKTMLSYFIDFDRDMFVLSFTVIVLLVVGFIAIKRSTLWSSCLDLLLLKVASAGETSARMKGDDGEGGETKPKPSGCSASLLTHTTNL